MQACVCVLCAFLLAGGCGADLATPHWFEGQHADHFSTATETWRQRYYMQDVHFGGPGSPIFVIMGGEGGIPPEVGIFYPWISEVLAKTHRALVLEPEHRFYGESLPFGNRSFEKEHLAVMNSQQALADAAEFIRYHQRARNCTARGTPGYCPVLTIGGSYPGFLSAMMRLRYPAVVDMAYAASAPMKFYSQQVGQYDYYTRVTESAERSLPGCQSAVLEAFVKLEDLFAASSFQTLVDYFELCSPLPPSVVGDKEQLQDNLLFLAQQTFANLNMANYPPDNRTGLHTTCAGFVAASAKGGSAPVDAIRSLLLTETQATATMFRSGNAHIARRPSALRRPDGRCFDLAAQLPAGAEPTARCGDWSGCGRGSDGEMWDYQTCTFEVEHIGFGSPGQMFPSRPWTMEWLSSHCARRFGRQPQPKALTDLWGLTEEELRAQASRIVFTNGLNDGWSVGGILHSLAPEKGLLSINLPNGAHHSDLSHGFGNDTPDVQAAHVKLIALVGSWIEEVKHEQGEHGREIASEAVVV